MTDPNLTHLYFLLDRSGSMQSIKDDTEGGFDAFIAEQRSQPGDCRVTLAQFDDRYEEVYQDVPVADVPPLSLSPRGSTALLDSIGRLLGEAGGRLAALPEHERPGVVIVGIMTDGHENSSREPHPRPGQGAHRAADLRVRVAVPLHGRRPGRHRGRVEPRRRGRKLDDLRPRPGRRSHGRHLAQHRADPFGRRRRRLRQGGSRPPRLRRRAASSRHRVTRRGNHREARQSLIALRAVQQSFVRALAPGPEI